MWVIWIRYMNSILEFITVQTICQDNTVLTCEGLDKFITCELCEFVTWIRYLNSVLSRQHVKTILSCHVKNSISSCEFCEFVTWVCYMNSWLSRKCVLTDNASKRHNVLTMCVDYTFQDNIVIYSQRHTVKANSCNELTQLK